jgi:soluble lytic murein transglycosylase-like protein
MLGRLSVVLVIIVLFSPMMSMTSYACDYEKCDGLPENITDCPICIYEQWDEELKEYTMELCKENGIRYSLVLAIIWNESRFNSDAIGIFNGQKCSYGLMQIEYVNFDWLCENIGLNNLDELLDPKINIQAGIAILKYHEPHVTTEQQMVLRYQVGEGKYSQMIRGGQYTTATCDRVIELADTLDDNIS